MLTQAPRQLDLFAAIGAAYAQAPDGILDNETLYRHVAERTGIGREQMEVRVPIGKAKSLRNPLKQRIRWFQQALRHAAVLQRVPGQRGVWQLSECVGKGLDRALAGVKLVAFSTSLGVAIWAHNRDVFPGIHEEIHLLFSSPPYPIRKGRAYGHVAEQEYTDFICSSLEPILRNLVPGGSVVLNISNDVYESGSPARSLYVERLLLAMNDRLGLSLMDRMPWVNLSKPPQPTYWACRTNVPQPRVQLCAAHELVYWFTNDPSKVRADNRRVLLDHCAKHQRLIAAGGEHRTTHYGDGAHQLREGSFGALTEGTIPRNVIERGHACADTRAYRQHAARLGLPTHGAMMPTSIPDFFIRFLTNPDDLVIDHFGGTLKTGLAAERLGRRWMATEWILQYLLGAAEMFRECNGFRLNPALA